MKMKLKKKLLLFLCLLMLLVGTSTAFAAYHSSSGGSYDDWSSAQSASAEDYSSWRDNGGSGPYSWSGTYGGGWGTYTVSNYSSGDYDGDSSSGGGGSSYSPTYYTVSASCNEGGTVSPPSRSVTSGSTTTFTFTPEAGYELVDVLVGTASQGVKSAEAYTYTTPAISGTTSISGVFACTNDLTISAIQPHTVRLGTTAMAAVICANAGSIDISAPVSLSIQGQTQSKSVTIPAKSTAIAVFHYTPATAGALQATAVINQGKTVVEKDYTNNICTAVITVKAKPAEAVPGQDTKRPIPSPPAGENTPSASWTEKGVNYNARLNVTASIQPNTAMKSGYGVTLRVTANIATNCPDVGKITQPQSVVMYLPEHGYTKVVTLQKTGANTWELPVNAISVKGARVWYVPVWFPDNTNYTGLITVSGAYTPGGELAASTTVSVPIQGSMYEDDSTNAALAG